MNDFAFLGIIVAFFVIAVLFVRACDRIIGPDVESGDVATDPATDLKRAA